ncbi:hypothetical protein DO021_09825 [Desulfobacter hydrogenophilus]|uniref:LysM domain-containing protein n=1 Tax=Desulfobacter hydrogenophilus TaxID=2291 RepID=A0A328FD54_9BACT|nr:LysM domain-containing protein [Desulfobacter hydrogenophilus]NDY72224.1 LysM peptidoglycan-binding domain-containing protein [Desulfobacter hydrogenophilus]QBH15094.1 LysM domain-containing protein [Desulfobacter hydrogenophilus]RAM02229.1 hypothetical protein DO021_09825 [Desulfobacter hydrogenophilus]
MAVTVTCPVCRFTNIPEGSDTCPQCDADLVCFRLLETLSDASANETVVLPEQPGQNITQNSGEKKYRIPVIMCLAGLLLIFLVLVFGYAANRFSIMAGRVEQMQASMTRMAVMVAKDRVVIRETGQSVRELRQTSAGTLETIKKQQETVSSSESQTAGRPKTGPVSPEMSPPPSPPVCFRQYQAKDTDTLWGISRALYGSGVFYPVLLEHNPGLDIYNISSRDTLRYLCDKKTVLNIYEDITGTGHGKRYWKYKIRPGDTRRSVIRQYCSHGTDCLVKDLPFKPGMTIGIYLE